MKSKLIVFNLLFITLQVSANDEWMRYSAISPDGTTIAFSYQGDLFTVNVQGGDAKQITSHPAYDYMPVWSNDSKKIAFASNRHGNFDVFLVDKDGGVPKRLTYHSSGDYPYAFDNTNSKVYYQSSRLDDYRSVQFPSALLGEIYEVGIDGGRERQFVSFSAEDLNFSKDGQFMIFHDKKGYEDPWRKHQTSSVARDIVLYDLKNKTFRNLTSFEGEDRDPQFIDNNSFYFLSEKSGSFNVWKGNVNGNAYEQQLTAFKDHPVRFLSMAENGTLCFGYHGSIYTLSKGEPIKLSISIKKDAVKMMWLRFQQVGRHLNSLFLQMERRSSMSQEVKSSLAQWSLVQQNKLRTHHSKNEMFPLVRMERKFFSRLKEAIHGISMK
jgi:tricorn protease